MALLEFLKKHKDEARKVFGERELKIIEKQLQGLTLKQSERNRLSRDVRKKLSFISAVSLYKDEFELKHGAKIKEIIKDVVGDIKKDILFYKVKKIVLFGSTAIGKRHLGSDVDIAVEFDEITEKNAFDFRMRILKYFDKLDVQVYNVLPDKVKKEIDKEGKVLYEKNK
ncbi:nucleotidyltransferase domain-containing protein [Candidatus Pacearchaeota archaeon]|nr:nucleotidyltransferase domain-containing protein [Candidatus Pacearchaeota archaeon]